MSTKRYSITGLTKPQMLEIARAITTAEVECEQGDDHRGYRRLQTIQNATSAVYRSMREQGVT